jgi:exosortase/archaeosortase family protein
MAPGMLGIAEACSGIRSLQSGLMYSLAVGELFFLTTGRRFALVGLTVICGFILNLTRTFILAYQTDLHGMEIIDKIHDKVGVTTSLVLPLVVWGMGRLLAGVEPEPAPGAESPGAWVQRRLPALPNLIPWAALALAAFLPCHIWLMVQDASIARQTTPYFNPRTNDTLNVATKIQEDVWKALSPSSGGGLRRNDPTYPMGYSDSWFFFWEPNKDNFNILWHHPERCMAGAGWEPDGPKREIELTLNGKTVRWYAFPWKRKNTNIKTVQLWGAWRNGQPVIGIESFHSLHGILSQLRVFSRGNSATEIVSVSVPYKDKEPPLEAVEAAVAQLFDYTGNPTR